MEAIASPPPAPTYNVRELLELERKIYDESIEKQERQHEILMSGEMEEYIAQCRPFELDREHELEVARIRQRYSKKNVTDLRDFELQQAEDDYQDQRRDLNRRLLEAARERRARVIARLQELEADPGAEDSKQKDSSRSSLVSSGSNRQFVKADGSLDTVSLELELTSCREASLAAFNLHHLEHNLPSAQAIVADVRQEIDGLEAYHRHCTEPETVCAVVVDTKASKIWIGLMDMFAVLDHVIVWSLLSDEDFYGQIVHVCDDAIELKLVCGSRMRVAVAQLRSRLCTMRRQDPSEQCSIQDDEALRTPKRKRQRRKHTIGMRHKI